MKKAIIDRETNSTTLVDDENEKHPLVEDVQILYPYKDVNGRTDKNKCDIIYKHKKLLCIEVEYLGEDKLDVEYIEKHLG